MVCCNIKYEISKKSEGIWTPSSISRTTYKRFNNLFSNDGDIVCDIFGGSGTVSRMCKVTNRNHIYIDMCNTYVKLAEELYV